MGGRSNNRCVSYGAVTKTPTCSLSSGPSRTPTEVASSVLKRFESKFEFGGIWESPCENVCNNVDATQCRCNGLSSSKLQKGCVVKSQKLVSFAMQLSAGQLISVTCTQQNNSRKCERDAVKRLRGIQGVGSILQRSAKMFTCTGLNAPVNLPLLVCKRNTHPIRLSMLMLMSLSRMNERTMSGSV